MKVDEENALIAQAVDWTTQAVRAVNHAGGSPEFVLSLFSEDLKSVLIRNGIQLSYRPYQK